MCVAVFTCLLPGSKMVKIAFADNHSTRVPTIDGREVVKLAKELTLAEWWTRGLAARSLRLRVDSAIRVCQLRGWATVTSQG